MARKRRNRRVVKKSPPDWAFDAFAGSFTNAVAGGYDGNKAKKKRKSTDID